MNKHLPGKHDQRKHGRNELEDDELWRHRLGNPAISLSKVIDKYKADLGAVSLGWVGDDAVSVGFNPPLLGGPRPSGYRYIGMLNVGRRDALVGNSWPTITSWFDVPVGNEHPAVLVTDADRQNMKHFVDRLESFAADTGVSKIYLPNQLFPISLLAKKGYKTSASPNIPDFVLAAVTYLQHTYDLDGLDNQSIDRTASDVTDLYRRYGYEVPFNELLKVPYPGQPELSLFTEFLSRPELMTMTANKRL